MLLVCGARRHVGKGILEFGPSPALKRGLSLTGRGKNLTPNLFPRGDFV